MDMNTILVPDDTLDVPVAYGSMKHLEELTKMQEDARKWRELTDLLASVYKE